MTVGPLDLWLKTLIKERTSGRPLKVKCAYVFEYVYVQFLNIHNRGELLIYAEYPHAPTLISVCLFKRVEKKYIEYIMASFQD